MDLLQQYEDFANIALAALAAAQDAAAVEAARVEFLGKKSGRIKVLQDLLGKATPEQPRRRRRSADNH